ncbi:hypothetical protein EVA_20505 [gut metagenome]|uniref:Uncharacterized protein n=1 Tax=gut metagenome TaxID=749906 RepID=J9FAC7_9ZZZZ
MIGQRRAEVVPGSRTGEQIVLLAVNVYRSKDSLVGYHRIFNRPVRDFLEPVSVGRVERLVRVERVGSVVVAKVRFRHIVARVTLTEVQTEHSAGLDPGIPVGTEVQTRTVVLVAALVDDLSACLIEVIVYSQVISPFCPAFRKRLVGILLQFVDRQSRVPYPEFVYLPQHRCVSGTDGEVAGLTERPGLKGVLLYGFAVAVESDFLTIADHRIVMPFVLFDHLRHFTETLLALGEGVIALLVGLEHPAGIVPNTTAIIGELRRVHPPFNGKSLLAIIDRNAVEPYFLAISSEVQPVLAVRVANYQAARLTEAVIAG